MGQCCSSNDTEGAGGYGDDEYIRLNRKRFISRSCTDIPCGIVFAIFLIAFVFVALWSFAMGDFRRVIHPSDSNGQICGLDIPDKPYLYFFDLAACVSLAPAALFVGCPTPQVCVAECPYHKWSWKSPNPDRSLMICRGGLDGNAPEFQARSIEDLVRNEDCAPYVFHSQDIFGRCLPTGLTNMTDHGRSEVTLQAVNKNNQKVTAKDVVRGRNLILKVTDVLEKIFYDLSVSWPVIVLCLALSVVMSFIWIVVMRCCGGVVIWGSIVCFFALLLTACGFSFYRWNRLRHGQEEKEFPVELELDLTLYFRFATLWLILAIVSGLVLIAFALILLFLYDRIQIAIAVLNEAGKALLSMPNLLFWPVFPLVLEVAVILLCLFVSLSLRSIADPMGAAVNETELESTDLQKFFRLVPCDPKVQSSAGEACKFLYYGTKKYTIYLQFFNLFMFFWLVNFIRALNETTVAGSFARYYYSQQDPHVMSRCPIITSFYQALCFHGGSLAFGSLLLALLQWIRVIFDYVTEKVKGFDNPAVRCLKRCCSCCLWCLEKFLKFLNRRAFILVAAHGTNFCTSASKAFGLIIRNVVRVFVIDRITAFLLFIGKAFIVLLCGILVYIFFEGSLLKNNFLASFRPPLSYIFIPVILTMLGAFILSTVLFSVYDMGVDTIFLCFLEDLERNDGSHARPYHMCDRLLKIVGKKNQPQPNKLNSVEME